MKLLQANILSAPDAVVQAEWDRVQRATIPEETAMLVGPFPADLCHMRRKDRQAINWPTEKVL